MFFTPAKINKHYSKNVKRSYSFEKLCLRIKSTILTHISTRNKIRTRPELLEVLGLDATDLDFNELPELEFLLEGESLLELDPLLELDDDDTAWRLPETCDKNKIN